MPRRFTPTVRQLQPHTGHVPWWAGLLAAVVVIAALAVPAAAHATYTSSIDGDIIKMQGDGRGDVLVISEAGGLVQHNCEASKIEQEPCVTSELVDRFDFDSTVAGSQRLTGAAEVDVDAGGGDDSVTVLAEVGVTELRGDAGDDTLVGSSRGDGLTGGAGHDRLVGGRSGASERDSVRGGDGNDVFVWSDGDGSDNVFGGDGVDETEVNGSAAVGDQFAIAPATGDLVRLDRTNLIPFTLDLDTTERLTVNGLGGNDVGATRCAMSDTSKHKPRAEAPKRGEAAWRAARDEIASRNERASRLARARRQDAYDRQLAYRQAAEQRERAKLAKRNS